MSDDADDWAGVMAGDPSALGPLFDRHEARLYRHATRFLSSHEDAKDAVLVAFFELWRRRARVRLVDGSPLPWLVATTTNTARNLERSSRRYRRLLTRVEAPVSSGEVRASDETGVVAMLGRLPARQRDVVVLTVIEQYTDAEAAQALGIPVGTVKSRLARAKRALRVELSESEVAS